ncbi:hypothetical protein FRX31_020038, partial [Thalictrum thalictroides]
MKHDGEGNPNSNHNKQLGKRSDPSWDNEDEEIDGLDVAIIKKYGEGSLEKLRREKAVNVVESGNRGGHGIQTKLGEQITTSQITEKEFNLTLMLTRIETSLGVGSLHIASQLFILRPWKLFVEAEFNDLKTIPIWVVMKRFPMELWDDEGFGRVASTIGKPLFVDKLTESMTRTSYA